MFERPDRLRYTIQPSESEAVLASFEDVSSLYELFRRLRAMAQQRAEIHGSSSTYGAKDLARLAVAAIEAMDAAEIESEKSVDLRNDPATWPAKPDPAVLQAVLELTRAAGFREAVLRAHSNGEQEMRGKTTFNRSLLDIIDEIERLGG